MPTATIPFPTADDGPRPDPTVLDQFTNEQLLAEVDRRRQEDEARYFPIFVVAEHYGQFREVYQPAVARVFGRPDAPGWRQRIFSVKEGADLRGLDRGSVIVLAGTYRDRPDIVEVYDQLRDREFRVLNLPDTHPYCLAALRAQAEHLGILPEAR